MLPEPVATESSTRPFTERVLSKVCSVASAGTAASPNTAIARARCFIWFLISEISKTYGSAVWGLGTRMPPSELGPSNHETVPPLGGNASGGPKRLWGQTYCFQQLRGPVPVSFARSCVRFRTAASGAEQRFSSTSAFGAYAGDHGFVP